MISIIIPCFNSSEFIERAVNSIIIQSFTDWELILVDNNSSDNTYDLLISIKKKNPSKRILVTQERESGSHYARNTGFKLAKGSWIQFLDADDELLPTKLENQLYIAKKNNADIVAGAAIFIETDKYRKEFFNIREVYEEDAWIALGTSRLGITSSNLFSYSIVAKTNGWNVRLSSSQEYDLMFRMMRFKECVVRTDSKKLTKIYKTNSAISRSNEEKKILEILNNRINLRISIKEFLRNNNELTAKRKKFINSYILNELLSVQILFPGYVLSSIIKLNLYVSPRTGLKLFYFLLKNKFFLN